MKPSWTVIRLTEAVGPAPGPAVQVGGSAEAGGELADADRVAAPEVAHGVAVLAVPLPPQRREPAQVVAVHLADVPRLGDQLGPGHHRVLGDTGPRRPNACSKSPSWRASVGARSKRNPSTCISVSQ